MNTVRSLYVLPDILDFSTRVYLDVTLPPLLRSQLSRRVLQSKLTLDRLPAITYALPTQVHGILSAAVGQNTETL